MNAAALSPRSQVGWRAPRIGILIVAYNAERTLPRVLDRIPSSVLSRCREIFIFDDASQDGTIEVALDCQQHFRGAPLSVHRNPTNQMYGGNQRRGYLYAMQQDLDIVVLLHGDGQYAPEVLDDLLRPLEYGRADMVMGSRMLHPGGALAGRMPTYKFIGNKVLTRIQNWLVGTCLSEFHSGYRAYSVAALRSIPLAQLTANWHFDTQIILEFIQRGYRIQEVPIPTFYGDEICRVNGIPYAAHCIVECLGYAVSHRRRELPLPESATTPRPAK
ncbi:MAG TPA: glycosyltransferase family 2 protein [Thermomicrobiaceae bacterium]|nr:glycosyltransferase family 2 protein [Thermomicrobiaceae bacterium]